MADQIEEKAKGISKLVWGGGSVSLFIILIILAQMSGGIRLLGDWTEGARKAVEDDLLHRQMHKRMLEVEDKLERICSNMRAIPPIDQACRPPI